jgi:hypothetical protein
MSRSGYSTDLDTWDFIKWRGQVASAIRGRRGQKLLSDLKAALEALPDKRLWPGELKTANGEMCALGVVGEARGLEMSNIDPEEPEQVAAAFDIAPQLAQEIVFENDETMPHSEPPEKRYERMLAWVESNIRRAETSVQRETEGAQ